MKTTNQPGQSGIPSSIHLHCSPIFTNILYYVDFQDLAGERAKIITALLGKITSL